MAHAGLLKNHKNAFLNDPRSQKWGAWPFSGLSLKVEKIHFGMIQRVKKYVFGHFKDFGHKLILTGGPQWFSIWGRLKTLIITFLSSLNVCLGPGWLIYFASKTWKYINIAHQDSHQSSCHPAWYTRKVMTLKFSHFPGQTINHLIVWCVNVTDHCDWVCDKFYFTFI